MSLLTADEPAAFELIRGARPVILVCDHASNRLPRLLNELGLATELLSRHIAWDIGARAVTVALAEMLDASAVLGCYSRLVVDLNRALTDSSAFPAISDGELIPGNLSLSALERERRARAIYDPYHRTIDDLLAEHSIDGRVPAFIGVHSFTPLFHGTRRPWQVGVLWDRDPRLALPLLAALRAEPGLVVGDNEPYSGRHPADYSMDHHAERTGLAHLSIEIRQDLIEHRAGQAEWSERLARHLQAILAESSIYRTLRR
jgi:predicted N-formylglutamate amidohydrolase